MKVRGAGALVWVALALGQAEAKADTAPSVWDIARDPAERDRWKLHVTVERLMHPHHAEDEGVSSAEEAMDDRLSLAKAADVLEQADAAHSPDVRLAFDLGVVYERLAELQGDDGLQEKVVTVLVPALDAAPDHPGAPEALYALAVAFAHVDRPRDELATWRRYIPKLADDRRRLLPMMNMGEAEMHLGQIDAALATFHAALDICQSLPNSAALSEPYALILWDIAIALDRQGDPVAAFRTAAKARSFSWTVTIVIDQGRTQIRTLTGWDAIRDYETVFFSPAWEREWYLALGEAAVALDSPDPRVAAKGWADAERHWDTYFTRATEPGRVETARGEREGVVSRWAAMAKLRRDYAHRARLAAEKRAPAKSPTVGELEP
jgi:tetratricopeptide (TPR) repeat protein